MKNYLNKNYKNREIKNYKNLKIQCSNKNINIKLFKISNSKEWYKVVVKDIKMLNINLKYNI